MNYTIGEVSKLLDISISTLRYYDKHGLLPLVDRTSGNIRVFNDVDLECLKMIDCLKSTGMQLKDIKQFFEWCEEGDSTIDKRYELFIHQRKETERQLQRLEKSLALIKYKCEYYALAKEMGTTSSPDLKNRLALEFLNTSKNSLDFASKEAAVVKEKK